MMDLRRTFSSTADFASYCEEKFSDGGRIQRFDPDFDSSCPCSEFTLNIDGENILVNTRCWRVGKTPIEEGQELVIVGDMCLSCLRGIGKVIKKYLDAQNWYNPYKIIVERKKDIGLE